jgi:hypothetical protein
MKNLIRCHCWFAALVALAATTTYAAPAPISVNELELKNVSRISNRAVSVFYAVGSAATVSMGNGVPFIRLLNGGPINADIRADGSASIPAGQVIRKGFQIFNYLVFVVHSTHQQNVSICNADGSVPGTQGLTSDKCSADYLNSVRFIYRTVQLNSARTAITQIGSTPVGDGSSVTLDLGAP